MIEKFDVHISDEEIDSLHSKIQLTRWPDEINDEKWSHGTSMSFLKKLSDHWLNEFNWRYHEKQINEAGSYKFKTQSGLKLHFLHSKSNNKNAIPQKLTGDNFYIKSNFHGYGGKSYQCIEVNDQIYLIWVDQLSKAMWLQILRVQEKVPKNDNEYLLCDMEPIQLTESIKTNFDTSFVIAKKNLLYGLCEIEHRLSLIHTPSPRDKRQSRKTGTA